MSIYKPYVHVLKSTCPILGVHQIAKMLAIYDKITYEDFVTHHDILWIIQDVYKCDD